MSNCHFKVTLGGASNFLVFICFLAFPLLICRLDQSHNCIAFVYSSYCDIALILPNKGHGVVYIFLLLWLIRFYSFLIVNVLNL